MQIKDNRTKGFTLIELLVVIAIIAILVVIVIVAINPAERLRDASDSRAQANVRASGTLVASCVALQNGNLNSCNSINEVEGVSGIYGKIAATVTFDFQPAVGPTTNICVWERGRTSNPETWYIYRTSDNLVRSLNAEPSANTCP